MFDHACCSIDDPAFERSDADSLHEECGVFGVWAPGRDVARLTYFGLKALPHRGQESAGIAVGDGGTVMVRKDLGLIDQVQRAPRRKSRALGKRIAKHGVLRRLKPFQQLRRSIRFVKNDHGNPLL